MKNFNQIMIAENGTITERQQQFKELHTEICRAGFNAFNYTISLCNGLKKMKDDNLFIEAGFETFDEYTENALGIKKRQAYNYIQVVEKLSQEYLDNNSNLCITKLIALSSIDDAEREQITSTGDIDEITVSELKKRIEQLEEEKDEACKQLEIKIDETDNLIKNAEKVVIEKTEAKITKLQAEIKKLKSLPPEKVEVKDEKTAAELKAAKEDLLKNANIIYEKEQELNKLKKQLETSGNEAILKFKIKFEEFQKLSQDLLVHLNALDADKKEKCTAALKKVIGGLAI